jgi:hypothetical protein
MPALSSKQLLDLAAMDPTRAGRDGHLQHIKMAVKGGGNTMMDPTVKRLLEKLAAVPVVARPKIKSPFNVAVPEGKKGEPFTPADIEFLRTLPDNPKKVTVDDARTVAALVSQAKFRTPDERLVLRVWTPIARVYAKRVAEAELAGARIKPPKPPQELLDLLQAAFMREDGLSADEAAVRASERLKQRLAEVERDRQIKQDNAERALARIDAELDEPVALIGDPITGDWTKYAELEDAAARARRARQVEQQHNFDHDTADAQFEGSAA